MVLKYHALQTMVDQHIKARHLLGQHRNAIDAKVVTALQAYKSVTTVIHRLLERATFSICCAQLMMNTHSLTHKLSLLLCKQVDSFARNTAACKRGNIWSRGQSNLVA